MTTTAVLSDTQQRTYDTVFRDPVAMDLAWRDVYALLRKIAEVQEEPNGSMKVTRNGHGLVLPMPLTKDVATSAELLTLRTFIADSRGPTEPMTVLDSHRLLVIDHHEARIYHAEVKDRALERLLPHDPADYFRHAHHSREFSRGKELPDPNSYFEPIAKALVGASRILVFGMGTGMSSEMDQFVAWLKSHHPDLAKRIIDTVVVDESHRTEGQLVATARACFTKFRRSHR
jgi:hypothetical protein